MSYTQGPWIAVARTNASIEIEAPDQQGYGFKKVASTSLTNHEANARLIAAAPDLLEACKTLVGLPNTEDWLARLRLAVEQARAAIAKAEGQI